jgi:hypothetical protein
LEVLYLIRTRIVLTRHIEQASQAHQHQSVVGFVKMQSTCFDFGKNCAQGPSAYGGGLIRPNHQRQFSTAIAQFFDGLVAPSDYQKALSLDGDLPTLGHDGTVGEKALTIPAL